MHLLLLTDLRQQFQVDGNCVCAKRGINIGSGTGSSALTGTLASRKNVSIQSGVEVTYAPLIICTPPDAKAGADRPLAFTHLIH